MRGKLLYKRGRKIRGKGGRTRERTRAKQKKINPKIQSQEEKDPKTEQRPRKKPEQNRA